jgi:signal transduction histidine kinase/DNA-binding response OmpR family regulator
MNPTSKKTVDQGTKILIVEDSPTQAEQLRYLLEGRGYKVTAAANGKKALEEARKRKPDIIISDIVMPQMDGFAFCKEIKSKERTKDIPVILLTALSSPQDVIKGLQCGADNFIRKPYDDPYLLSRVDYLVTNRDLRKSEKVQVGIKIRFAGEDYLITSERQQILDLLISIYEEAVYLNSDLVRSNESLAGLYRIAVDLNGSLGVQSVAEKTLARAAELPGVRAGWISLYEGEAGAFRVAAARGLPPALEIPCLEGDCLCRRRLVSGELVQAVNVLECERLQKAKGDTQGLRYHASVPLWSDGRKLGLLNLAGGEQGMFSDEELKILHGVGNQVAVALERASLYESLEKKVEQRTAALRAEIVERERAQNETRRNLERIRALHEIDLAITSTLDLRAILTVLLEKIELFLPIAAVTTVRLLNRQTGELESLACRGLDEKAWSSQARTTLGSRALKVIKTKTPVVVSNIQTDARTYNPAVFRGLVSYLGVPLIAHDEVLGILSLYTRKEHEFTREEIDFLNTLAGQAAIAIHNAQLYEKTVKADRVKTEFLSVMSHELRTPLSVVMGYTGLIKEGNMGAVTEQQKDALQKVLDRAGDQLHMINAIMQTTQLEGHAITANNESLDLHGLLDQLRSDFEIRSDKKSVRLIWDYPAAAMPVVTDGAKIRQILQNLINNALKFTEKGTVGVSARIVEEDGDRDPDPPTHASRLTPPASQWVEFTVTDTGIGIAKEMQHAIFEKFYQVDSSETRLYGGVGLGLYIVQNFTDLLGGKVEVESEPGKGSTFTVKIPLEK